MRLKQIRSIDDKHVNLVTVYLNQTQCISTVTEILPSCYPFHLCMTEKKKKKKKLYPIKFISLLKLCNPKG